MKALAISTILLIVIANAVLSYFGIDDKIILVMVERIGIFDERVPLRNPANPCPQKLKGDVMFHSVKLAQVVLETPFSGIANSRKIT